MRRRALLDALGGNAVETVIDPGIAVVRSRLAVDGVVSDQCETAMSNDGTGGCNGTPKPVSRGSVCCRRNQAVAGAVDGYVGALRRKGAGTLPNGLPMVRCIGRRTA